jgi:hypothetical protein
MGSADLSEPSATRQQNRIEYTAIKRPLSFLCYTVYRLCRRPKNRYVLHEIRNKKLDRTLVFSFRRQHR